MENYPLEQRIVVVSLKNGLHVRPMSLIVQAAGQFPGDVHIRREDGYAVNAKSMFDLLTLRAEYGMRMTLEAKGQGAVELLDRLESLFDSGFEWGEEQSDDSPSPQMYDTCPQPVDGE